MKTLKRNDALLILKLILEVVKTNRILWITSEIFEGRLRKLNFTKSTSFWIHMFSISFLMSSYWGSTKHNLFYQIKDSFIFKNSFGLFHSWNLRIKPKLQIIFIDRNMYLYQFTMRQFYFGFLNNFQSPHFYNYSKF